jgi:hypothetical protein
MTKHIRDDWSFLGRVITRMCNGSLRAECPCGAWCDVPGQRRADLMKAAEFLLDHARAECPLTATSSRFHHKGMTTPVKSAIR